MHVRIDDGLLFLALPKVNYSTMRQEGMRLLSLVGRGNKLKVWTVAAGTL